MASFNKKLLNNVIEEDLQSILRPLNLMQSLFICAKYSIRDHIITSNTNLYYFIRVLLTLIYRGACLHQVIIRMTGPLHNEWWGTYSLFFCVGYFINFIFYLIGDLVNGFSNILHSHFNILLVLKIQFVLRALQINGDEIRTFVLYNWKYTFIFNLLSISYVICYCFTIAEISIMEVITAYASIAYDINVIYALLLLKLIQKMLRVWIGKVQKSRNPEELETEEYWNAMLDVYLHILDGYMIIQKTFQQMILYYVLFGAFLSLWNVATVLTLKGITDMTGDFRALTLPLLSHVWSFKNIIVIICLSVECERFYASMRDVQRTCVMLMKSRNCSDPAKKVCKSIQRVQKASFKKITACGLFIVDAELPLRLSSFLSTYTIVFIEFTYLKEI